MRGHFVVNHMSSFRIIILGFLAVILVGTLLLSLPAASAEGIWTPAEDALFTATSSVCVTGLVIRDTATYWSVFGQVVILILIQIGGLGIVSITAMIAAASGKKISLLQRSLLQETLSANQVGGLVKLLGFIYKAVLITELAGAVMMLPSFCSAFGLKGIWMAVFHSVSAFCNAGFDLMGDKTGEFSSLTSFAGNLGIVIPVSLLIVIGGIGFLTWEDIAIHRFHFRKYRMQSKAILTVTAVLILLPALFYFFNEFAMFGMKERICLSLFQSITPRTAGFNTADLSSMSSAGISLTIILMLIGGSPGSTAGGMKTTTAAVLIANSAAAVCRRKSCRMFGRRIDEQTVRTAATLLLLYLFLSLTGAFLISVIEDLPFSKCLFETVSAIGTVGLSLGITTLIGPVSRMILIVLMFLGRVGGLTLIYAAVNSRGVEVAQLPVEKINVG